MGSGQPAQKCRDRSSEVLGLIERKSVAGIRDLLDTDKRIDVAELDSQVDRDDR